MSLNIWFPADEMLGTLTHSAWSPLSEQWVLTTDA